MTFVLPLRQCLALAEKRISDAVFAVERMTSRGLEVREEDTAWAADLEKEARDFLAIAASQGWDGDVDATIAGHFKMYRAS